MQSQTRSPRTDDFRLERDGGKLMLTFTPDGRVYTFSIENGRLSEPSVSPARVSVDDFVEDEVRKAATELARLALKGAPTQE